MNRKDCDLGSHLGLVPFPFLVIIMLKALNPNETLNPNEILNPNEARVRKPYPRDSYGNIKRPSKENQTNNKDKNKKNYCNFLISSDVY